jgi:hypothetical protein
MSDIKVNIDIGPLTQFLDNFVKEISKDVKQSIKALAVDTHTHIKEEAQNKLHSFREQYLESLSPPEQVDDYLWVITLDEKAEWIETGRPDPWDMKPGLLKDGKTSKDGHKYRVVPMNQAKTSTQLSSGNREYEQNMINKVKFELKKKGISYKKLELDPKTGSPRIGKLHSLDIDSYIPGKGNTPQLHGINIYQTKQKDGSVKRSITTFRTVTDKENQKDKWIHPSVEAKNFFLEAKKFAEEQWETKVLPALMDKYRGK